MSKVIKNITELMNVFGRREYTAYEVRTLRYAIEKEYDVRKRQRIYINTRTEKGRQVLNERIQKIIFEQYNIKMSYNDILLYKKCKLEEYSIRTKRCAWGFKEIRQRQGYDPITGVEL